MWWYWTGGSSRTVSWDSSPAGGMCFRFAEYLIEVTASPTGAAVVAVVFLLRALTRSCIQVSRPKPMAWYPVDSTRPCSVRPRLQRRMDRQIQRSSEDAFSVGRHVQRSESLPGRGSDPSSTRPHLGEDAVSITAGAHDPGAPADCQSERAEPTLVHLECRPLRRYGPESQVVPEPMEESPRSRAPGRRRCPRSRAADRLVRSTASSRVRSAGPAATGTTPEAETRASASTPGFRWCWRMLRRRSVHESSN